MELLWMSKKKEIKPFPLKGVNLLSSKVLSKCLRHLLLIIPIPGLTKDFTSVLGEVTLAVKSSTCSASPRVKTRAHIVKAVSKLNTAFIYSIILGNAISHISGFF